MPRRITAGYLVQARKRSEPMTKTTVSKPAGGRRWVQDAGRFESQRRVAVWGWRNRMTVADRALDL
jgi:hypothetical protein